ncbi:hypothetical protein ACF061_00800 [Streptomyces sp. NPDC015220]|uniref:hypothetical protein n=1 Tax=Streptomyces sp. NPDC015220 TaxID=3364947 RepID=UPI0036F8C856
MTTTARITQLREAIARRALTDIGVPVDARILDVQRVGTVFIVATAEPNNRWSPYTVETFRTSTADDIDPRDEDDAAAKRWIPLAGWNGDGADEVPGMLAQAVAYAREVA